MPERWVPQRFTDHRAGQDWAASIDDGSRRRGLRAHPVAKELLAGPSDDPARLAIAGGWGRRLSPGAYPAALLEWGLGVGETSVLALALEHQPCTVILDDAAARAAARTFGVRTLGTIGLLVRAKLRNLIPSAAQAISEVRGAGLYVDDAIVAAALHETGEDRA